MEYYNLEILLMKKKTDIIPIYAFFTLLLQFLNYRMIDK